MLVCKSCGLGFWPQGSAWGDELCGECIGERIQEMLTANMPRTRRPMRRGADLLEQSRAADSSEDRKASNE